MSQHNRMNCPRCHGNGVKSAVAACNQTSKKAKVMLTYPSVVMVTMVYQKEAGMEVKVEPLVPFSA